MSSIVGHGNTLTSQHCPNHPRWDAAAVDAWVLRLYQSIAHRLATSSIDRVPTPAVLRHSCQFTHAYQRNHVISPLRFQRCPARSQSHIQTLTSSRCHGTGMSPLRRRRKSVTDYKSPSTVPDTYCPVFSTPFPTLILVSSAQQNTHLHPLSILSS